ncbi:thioesterase II family protein [Catenulispora yoronensis]
MPYRPPVFLARGRGSGRVPRGRTGASAFRDWRGALPADWRFTVVNLPGREGSYGAPFATDMAAVADDIAAELLDFRAGTASPLVLFGHSMGGLLALLVAARVPTAALVVAACAPPGAHRYRYDPGDSRPDDDALREDVAEALAAAGITELIDEAADGVDELLAEMVELAVPALRADIELLTSFQQLPHPLGCRILALYGDEDALDPEPWSAETTAAADHRVLPGATSSCSSRPTR